MKTKQPLRFVACLFKMLINLTSLGIYLVSLPQNQKSSIEKD